MKAAEEERRAAMFASQIDGLWGDLLLELRRLSYLYNKEMTDTLSMRVDGTADRIEIETPRSGFVLALDRERRTLHQTIHWGRDSLAGLSRGGSFIFDEDRLSFARGTSAEFAAALIEDLLQH